MGRSGVPSRLPLTRHGREMPSVFSLLGTDENDLTCALGWALSRSPGLLAALTGDLDPAPPAPTTRIDLEVADRAGRTDLELRGTDHGVIVEAKRGWALPTVAQLAAYAPRLHGLPVGHLLTLSDCSPAWAALNLPDQVDGVRVTHLPWSRVLGHLGGVRRAAGGHERLWLDQLHTYLKEALRVIEVENSTVYCVAASQARPGGGGPHTFQEVVIDEGCYYYPYGWGHGWPPVPPNFLAFRWDNRVQRVQRVVDYEVVGALQDRWPTIPRAGGTDRPHMVCRLGPPLRMEPLPAGRNFRATRVWVLLDQLFTEPTLVAALRASQRLRGEPVSDDDVTV